MDELSYFEAMAQGALSNPISEGNPDEYERVTVFDKSNIENIADHIEEYGRHGIYHIALSPQQIEAIKLGKVIVWGQIEYTVIISADQS